MINDPSFKKGDFHMNSVSITGRLGQDPELRYTQSGKPVTNLSVANNTGFGDNRQTHWFTVVAWNGQAEAACTYLRKGSPVGVEGFLQTRKWTDRDGNPRTSIEIVANRVDFLGSGSDKAAESTDDAGPPSRPPTLQEMDDVPF
jgi:single-strand DNA-binding protein